MEKDNVDEFKTFLESFDAQTPLSIDEKNFGHGDGFTFLHYAAAYGSYEIAKYILE